MTSNFLELKNLYKSFGNVTALNNVSLNVSKGEVEVIDKKGFWIKIKKDSVEGWTKLNNVEIDKDSNFSLSSLAQ